MLFFMAALMLLPSGAASESFHVDARGAVLIDADSGRVLFQQNMDEMLPMASTTKLMTALLALENSRLDEPVTAGENAYGVPGTSIYLSRGETLSMEHMLYGLMLRSGNDAAVAIAEHVGGSVEKFVEMMNARAAEIGADAHYANPHGLDAEGHSASALGLAKIMRECMRLESFRVITSTKKKVIPWDGNDYSRVLQNKNKLLSGYEGATGGKTGYTSKAGRCLVFSAERDGLEIIGVVLRCPTWFDTAAAMLDYGFEHYTMVTALPDGGFAASVPVKNGMRKEVSAVVEGDLRCALGDAERYSVTFETEALTAPVEKGQRVGTARMMASGKCVAERPLVASEGVEERSMESALLRLLRRWLLLFEDA